MDGYHYMACPAESVDADSGQCAVPLVAVDPPSFIPPLTVGEGAQIAMGICACWLVGFGIKTARRVLWST